VLFRSFAAFGLFRGLVLGSFVYLEACLHFLWVVSLGFLCMLESLYTFVLMYLEALCAFFFLYIIH
jgi:hypothetical protein